MSRPVETEVVFPISLAEEVFELLNERKANCVRYCDLDYESCVLGSRYRYLDEFVRSMEGGFSLNRILIGLLRLILIRKGKDIKFLEPVLHLLSRNRKSPTVILQHDADVMPERTLLMMEKEKEYGLVSSNYFFRKPSDFVPYKLDLEKMNQFENFGFEIGYHQNAYERSEFDFELALRLMEEDVKFYSKHFDLRSFVPHGGKPGPRGLDNDFFPHIGSLSKLLWAYNGKCILKHYTWSDGGIKKRAPSDPRDFVKRLLPGTRAIMLLHPQYYGNEIRHDWENLPISKQSWWRNLWGL